MARRQRGGAAIHTFLLKILRFGIYFLITYVYIQSRRFIWEAYMRLRAAGERTAGGMAGDGGVTACGTEGGEPVRTESVSVRSGSFGGGAR